LRLNKQVLEILSIETSKHQHKYWTNSKNYRSAKLKKNLTFAKENLSIFMCQHFNNKSINANIIKIINFAQTSLLWRMPLYIKRKTFRPTEQKINQVTQI